MDAALYAISGAGVAGVAAIAATRPRLTSRDAASATLAAGVAAWPAVWAATVGSDALKDGAGAWGAFLGTPALILYDMWSMGHPSALPHPDDEALTGAMDEEARNLTMLAFAMAPFIAPLLSKKQARQVVPLVLYALLMTLGAAVQTPVMANGKPDSRAQAVYRSGRKVTIYFAVGLLALAMSVALVKLTGASVNNEDE